MPLVSRFDAIAAKTAVRQLEPTVPVETCHRFRDTHGDRRPMPGDGLRQPFKNRSRDADSKRRRAGRDADQRNSGARHRDRSLRLRASPVNQGSATEPPLSLLMAITGDVLWIETLEDQLLRREQLQLIGAMARAIRGPDVRTAHQQFDWPPRAGPALSAHSGGLTGMLTGFLQRLMTDHDAQIIIQLGQVASLPAAAGAGV